MLSSEWGNEVINTVGEREELMSEVNYESCLLLNTNITSIEVKDAAWRLKRRKSVGVDLLPNEILKNNYLTRILQALFQKCFDAGLVPSAWTKAIIKPIPKAADSDPRIPANYRGISLLSCLSKMFTSILNRRITNHINANNGLVEEQNGFRAGRSCVEHIFCLQSMIQTRQVDKLSTFVTFIDFSKEFDRVNRESLLYKLLHYPYPIDGKMYHIIKALYSNTMSCVKINELGTEWFETLQGVRQGDNLSPTLFALFVNDLAMEIKAMNVGVKVGERQVPILLYADDVAIISETETDMQAMLNVVREWCNKWNMSVNLTKTKAMHFRIPNSNLTQTKFLFGNDEVKYVKYYKYLGVYFDEFLNFDFHKQEISDSGLNALGGLIQKYKNIECMSHRSYKRYFDTCVWPVVDYGAEVWGYNSGSSIESVQTKAIRIFLGVHKFAAHLAISGDIGWIPCEVKLKISTLRLWNKLVKMEDSRLPKIIFNHIFENKGSKWIDSIQDVCNELGFHLSSTRMFDIDLCKSSLMDTFKHKWATQSSNKPKLRSYVQFKQHYFTENYINLNLNREQRSILAQVRCGTLPLKIETGRFVGTPKENRLCDICNNGQVEDEFHFIFYCEFYSNERNEFYDTIKQKYLNFDNILDAPKLRCLFTFEPRLLSKFLLKIFQLRQDFLYA